MMFDGTAPYYQRFRPPPPDSVVDTIVAQAPGVDGLLDLGTGTGQVLQAVGPRMRELVVGVEPDLGMLSVAEQSLSARSWPAKVELWQGKAEEAPLGRWPAPDIATVCRAFHWMDQPAVMRRVREHLRPGGLFVVMGDGSLWRDDLDWTAAVIETVKRYLGPRRRAGQAVYAHHDIPFAQVLADGGFRDVQVVNHRFDRVWEPRQILGYLYSTSFSARPLYGERLGEFERDLLATLEEIGRGGPLVEPADFELVMGYK